jgi:alanyl-tRNA synthetase
MTTGNEHMIRLQSSNDLRKAFLDFFASKGHYITPGISLVPTDPSIFLTSAGVVAVRDVIEGREEPEHLRVAGCQRCARTTDIENVGRHGRHHTFFEMLGNFSFGDYYKRESIVWGMEFLTDVVGLDRDRIWATIYPDDEEAYGIWTREIGLPDERIIRLEDNFWGPIAVPGACGPDSEMYYDIGPEFEGDAPGDDGDRYLEFWNHVFTELQQQPSGERVPLPRKNIDTGMGLERLARIAQGVPTVYDTDLFAPIMSGVADRVREAGGRIEGEGLFRQRIIADHARAAAFMIMDGILPENSGREYILRRLIRRADREGKMLGLDGPFLHTLVATVVAGMKDAYPELAKKQDFITKAIRIEEERFFQMLPQGMAALESLLEEPGRHRLTGAEAFNLWSTYGFPVEMTGEILGERGLPLIDQSEYEAAAEEHSGLSGKHSAGSRAMGDDLDGYPATEFVGYDTLECKANVLGVISGNRVILDRTPFYAESGGQSADHGTINDIPVTDTQKVGGVVLHTVETTDGLESQVTARVDQNRRNAIRRAHTATHLLHWALHQVVGSHATQKGSLVEPDRLRFDFSNLQGLTLSEIAAIETLVNERVLANEPVDARQMPIAEARNLGAMMLFGEKYGSEVRVLNVGGFSKELCGGTHVSATGDIGLVKIISESSIASGTRRIEAVTGMKSLEYVRDKDALLAESASKLGGSPNDVPTRIDALNGQITTLKHEIARLRKSGGAGQIDSLAESVQEVEGVKLVCGSMDDADADQLKTAVDTLAERIGSGVVALGSARDGKVIFVIKVSADLTGKAHAGNLVREVAKIAGGGGGGRPDFAQAGGKDPGKLSEALDAVPELLRAQVSSR